MKRRVRLKLDAAVTPTVRLKPDPTYEPAPPRLAEWLLRRALPRGERGDTIRGDLVEEWRERGW